jgi:secreted trypsin-like serine protease
MRGIARGLLVAAVASLLAAPAGFAVADVQQPPPTKIVGGVDATETYSFMAHLDASPSTEGGWGCGASLIRPTWIITARHCVALLDGSAIAAEDLSFRIGTLQERSGGTVVTGKQVIMQQPNVDTALVELSAPVTEAPIDIAPAAPVGSPIRIIGWGCITDPGCQGPDILQQLDTSILPDNTCGGGATYLCVNNPDGVRGACYGDSGGPAVLQSGTSWVLVGNTSGGTSAICGQGPSVYVDLPNLRSWIEEHAGPDTGAGTPSAP